MSMFSLIVTFFSVVVLFLVFNNSCLELYNDFPVLICSTLTSASILYEYLYSTFSSSNDKLYWNDAFI